MIRDIVGEYWVERLGLNGNGALVITVYEADTLEPDGSRVNENAIANARIYNQTTIWVEDPDNEGEFLEKGGTVRSDHARRALVQPRRRRRGGRDRTISASRNSPAARRAADCGTTSGWSTRPTR